MEKKQVIINHGLLRGTVNYTALIEAQINSDTQVATSVLEAVEKIEQPKVKTLGKKGTTPYTRMQHK